MRMKTNETPEWIETLMATFEIYEKVIKGSCARIQSQVGGKSCEEIVAGSLNDIAAALSFIADDYKLLCLEVLTAGAEKEG